MKRRLLTALLLFSGLSLYAQTTNVTATITDPSSTVWVNGKWQAQLYNAKYPSSTFTINGVPLTPAQTQLSGSINGSGVISVTMSDTSQVVPAGTVWNFTLCSNTSTNCNTNIYATATGATDNLSTVLSSQIVSPKVIAGPNAFAYNDTEMITPPSPGQVYYNVTSLQQRLWNGSIWTANSTSGTCAVGTCILNNPLVSQTVSQPAGTSFTFADATTGTAVNFTNNGGWNFTGTGTFTDSAGGGTVFTTNISTGNSAIFTFNGPIEVGSSIGTPGQVFTATGTGAPVWANPAAAPTLSTIGTSGRATLIAGVINIPLYAGSGVNADITSLTDLTSPLPVNEGGTGTTSPGLINGSNITITGSWPNQTISSSSNSLPAATGPGQAPVSSAAGTAYAAQQVIVAASLSNYNVSDLPVTYGNVTSGSNTVTVVDASSWTTGEGVFIPAVSTNSSYPANGIVCDNVTVSGNTITMFNADTTACNAGWTSGSNSVPVFHFDMTHGAITSGATTLTVSSAATFAAGQGILVKGAGASGADLITAIASISGTTITLSANAGTTVTVAQVFHDDTAALAAALAASNYVRVPAGTYYLSSETDITRATNLYGDGLQQSAFISMEDGINTLVAKSSGITGHDFGIYQPDSIMPTSGDLLDDCDIGGTDICFNNNFSRLMLYRGWNGFGTYNKTIQGSFSYSTIHAPVNAGIYIDNPPGYGDVDYNHLQVQNCNSSCTTGTYGLLVDASDTNPFDTVKFNSFVHNIWITGQLGAVDHLRFHNVSFEDGSTSLGSAIQALSSYQVFGIQFDGGDVEDSLYVGNGVSGFQANGLRFYGDGPASAYTIDVAGQSASITSNSMQLCGDCVRLEATAQNVTVTGNHFYGATGWGIHDMGSSGPNVVSANTYSNMASGNSNVPTYQEVDQFAGTSGTAITSHIADTGQSWTYWTIDGGTDDTQLSGSNTVKSFAGATSATYYSSLIPSSPNYTVSMNCNLVSAGSACVVYGRMVAAVLTDYQINLTGTSMTLYKVVAGSATTLGTYSATFSTGTTYNFALVMNGTSISAVLNGSTVISAVTDTAIPAAGFAGFNVGAASSAIGSDFKVANNSGLVTQAATQEYVQDVASNDLPLTGGTLTGNTTFSALAPATSSTTVSSPGFSWTGHYWNGTASTSDTWTCTNTFNTAAGFTNPPSVLTCTHAGSSGGGTFQVGNLLATNINAPTVGIYSGNLNLDSATSATSGSNYPSSTLNWQDSYWTGSTFTNSGYALQLVDGTGTNPTQTLLLTRGNAGSGAQLIDFSAEPITLSTTTVNKLYFGSGGPEILTGSGAPSGTYPLGSIYIDISSGTLSVYAAGAWHTITTS